MSVGVLDLESDALAATDVSEGYRSCSFVVRVGRRPVGVVCLPIAGDGHLDRDALDERLGEWASAPPGESLLRADELPPITVVVCTTFSRPQALLACLSSLDALDGRPAEILLIDNRQRVDRREYAAIGAFSGVRILHEPRYGLAAARNCGLAAATGEVVAFTDDDVIVDPMWLRAIGSRLRAHPDEAGVCGLVLPRNLETSAQVRLETYRGGFGPRGLQAFAHRLERLPSRIPLRMPRVSAVDASGLTVRTFPLYQVGQYGVGANMAFRAAVLREAGGFDARLGAGTPACGGEDIELFVRLVWSGACLSFEPAAIVFHEHRRSESALATQMRQYGIGFTAALTALVVTQPRHIFAMAATGSATITRLAMPRGPNHRRGDPRGRPRGSPTGRSEQLRQLEFRGRLRGPDAFLRSWLRARRA